MATQPPTARTPSAIFFFSRLAFIYALLILRVMPAKAGTHAISIVLPVTCCARREAV